MYVYNYVYIGGVQRECKRTCVRGGRQERVEARGAH